MKRMSSLEAGGTCAMALTASYVVAGLTYLLLGPDQKGGTILHQPARYLESLNQDATLLVANHLALGIGALLGIGVVLAVWEWIRPHAGGWMPWLSALGVLGFAVTALDNFQIAAIDPMRAADFARTDAVGRTAIAVTGSSVSIDPQMWLSFGLTGLWILAVSRIIARERLLPALHPVLGVLAAVSYLSIEVASAMGKPGLMMASAGVGGLVVGPIWYGWLGIILRRSGRVVATAEPGPSPGVSQSGC